MQQHQTIYAPAIKVEKSADTTKNSGLPARRPRGRSAKLSGMDKLPLPDLYLIDSRKLLTEVDRIRQLTLSVPPSAETHAAMQSVIDALWHLRRDMEDIINMQAVIQSSFAAKGEALNKPADLPRMSLRVL